MLSEYSHSPEDIPRILRELAENTLWELGSFPFTTEAEPPENILVSRHRWLDGTTTGSGSAKG